MRTTLNLDDDVLASAREIAQREGRSLGSVLSVLARQALARGDTRPLSCFRPLGPRGAVVTNELIRELRDATDE